MDKTEHVLSAIRSLRYPKRLLFWDSESKVAHWAEMGTVKPHTPRLIESEFWEGDGHGDYRLREAREFGRSAHPTREESEALTQDFWDYVAHIASSRMGGDRGSLVVVAHNIGYDVQATGGAARLLRAGWRCEPPYSKGPIFIWRFSKDHRTITLLSSTNWYQAKLDDVGEAYGIRKLDTDTQTDDMDALRVYCKRDVEILRVAVIGLIHFLRDNDLGPWADTISSVSFKSFRYRFMRHSIEMHVDPEATGLERAAYHGGRTECAFIGDVLELPVYCVDVNSLYPSVMLDRLYPVRLLEVRHGDVTLLREAVETGSLVIADVRLSIERPALPHVDDKLLFPVGTFRTTLCSPELQIAFREGTVHEVFGWSVYEGAPIFADFIAFMYRSRLKAREEGKEALSRLFKDLGNTLYGKFGQRRENWVCLGEAEPGSPIAATETFVDKDGNAVTERIFGGYRWTIDGPLLEAFNSFPAIAAFVTSYARCVLLGGMRVAGDLDPEAKDARASREFFYCDTDSLFVSQRGYDRLLAAQMIDPMALGKFKMEGREDAHVVFRGAKFYEFGKKVRRKGIPAAFDPMKNPGGTRDHWPDGRPVLTADGRPAVTYDTWPKLLTHLREGNLETFENRPIVKRTEVEYDKGHVMESGWVRPLRLGVEEGVVGTVD